MLPDQLNSGTYDTNQEQKLYNCCAHEIGHILGLSKRDGFDPASPRDSNQHPGHDMGIFPTPPQNNVVNKSFMYYMNGDDRWLRHEDWDVANDSAKKYLKP